MQGAHRVGIHFRQDREDFRDARLAFGCGPGAFPVSWYLDFRARLFLLAGALAAFGGSLLGGFHLDDYATFPGAVPSAIGWPHPLTHLVGWLNFQVVGQEPAGYHAVNLSLHLAAVLLAYECLRLLLPARVALLAAAIFAVHPLQAEAVNYVSARGVMVVTAVGLGALWAWLAGRRWMAAVLAAVAMAETGVRPGSYAYGLTTLRFLRLLVWPWGFTIAPDLREPLWIAIAAAGAVVALAVWRRRTLSLRSAWTWTLLGLVLLVPCFFGNPAADPRAYLAMFAFAAAVGLILARVPDGVSVAVVILLAAVSVNRTYVWMSDERLWREAVRRAPNLVEPKIQLAKSLRAGDALEWLNRARQQAPYDPDIPAEIGKVLLDEQQYQGAVEELSRAVAMNPGNALAFNNRGVALAALGQRDAASADFEQAVRLDAHLSEARENLKRLGGIAASPQSR
jgi:hypothetical protein